jgi:GGDEF domain-containing protein
MPINWQAVQFLHPSPPPARAEAVDQRHAIGRIAALVWAAIALFGVLATLGPVRFSNMDVSETRLVVFSAAAIAAITFALPWSRLPRVFVNVLLIAMAGYVTALAHGSGAVHDPLTMVVTFAVALAVCFLPVRAGVAQVALIALLLAGGLYLLGRQENGVQALRTSLLLSGLVVLCGLMLILRSTIAAREAAAGRRIFSEDLPDAQATRKRLDRELAAAARRGDRVSVVLIEVTSPPDLDGLARDQLAAALGDAILERIRLTDSAGRLARLTFAVIAPDHPDRSASDAAALARELENTIRERLEGLGHEPGRFAVATAWSDNGAGATTAAAVLESARADLAASSVAAAA